MKAIYLDTALLVACLVHEPGTAAAHRYLGATTQRVWLISNWVATELASALSMQCRRGAIQASERFQELRHARLRTLAVGVLDFEAAARLCLADALPLRSGDALHLALCQRYKCQLVSFDHAMCTAAAHHDVAVQHLTITD